LNQGIRYSLAQFADWIFTFDQDSAISVNFAEKMLNSFYEAQKLFGNVGILSPFYIDQNSLEGVKVAKDVNKSNLDPSSHLIRVKASITSGSLFPKWIFEQVGFFRDDFFIDRVDHEFCFRCRRDGISIVIENDITMAHHIGNQSVHFFLGLKILVTNHDAIRHFYRSRNSIKIFREYTFFDNIWLSEIIGIVLNFIKILFYENDKKNKFLAVFRGIRMGFL
jgi:rhamnosyltransferase